MLSFYGLFCVGITVGRLLKLFGSHVSTRACSQIPVYTRSLAFPAIYKLTKAFDLKMQFRTKSFSSQISWTLIVWLPLWLVDFLFVLWCIIVCMSVYKYNYHYRVVQSRKGRMHLDLYMWTLDKPTASIWALAWMVILLNPLRCDLWFVSL